MKNWPSVPLGDVVRHRKEFITLDDANYYKRCRVQTSARGVVLRDIVSGSDIKTKTQQMCRTGEFLVAEIDAKMGGYGLVPPELDGAVVSSHYFLFEPDQARIDRHFLDWYAKTPGFAEQIQASGSTNYAAIRPSQVLGYTMPLPPLLEQHSIVSRLDQAAAAVAERGNAAGVVGAEVEATLRAAFARIIANAPRVAMGEIAPLVRRPVVIDPDASYPELGVRSFGKGTFHKPALPGIEVGTKKLFTVEAGDLVFNIVFAWEGAVAVAADKDAGRVGSHRFLTCVPDPNRATSEFLRFWFLGEEGMLALGQASPGGAGRNRTLGIKALEAIKVPVPSLDALLWFDSLQGKARAAKAAQAEATAHLDQLLPAMLNEVFG